jgi:hypothetical protein
MDVVLICRDIFLYFSLEEKYQKNWPFCTPGFVQAFGISYSRISPPNTSHSPFRLWRNDVHPWVEALKGQIPPAVKRPNKKCSYRGLRKISVFLKMEERSRPSLFSGTGRNCCLNPGAAGKSSIPSVNDQTFSRRFFVSRSFLRHFFLKKVANTFTLGTHHGNK